MEKNQLSPLILPNAKEIWMHALYFRIVWSHRCENLYLYNIEINKDFCDFISDNCDCSGVIYVWGLIVFCLIHKQ